MTVVTNATDAGFDGRSTSWKNPTKGEATKASIHNLALRF